MRKFTAWLRINITLENFENLHNSLIEESSLNFNYIVLIIGAAIIATLGLLSNSAAVIIGAMIIAPLMLPIRGLAFGAIEGNFQLLHKSLISLLTGTILAIILALLIGFLVRMPEFGSEVISRSEPTLLDLGIAITAGAISGFAKVKPKISESLAGTAIAVALMPPICVVGLSLSQGDWSLSLGASLLYLTNLLGITLACMLTFLITGYIPLYKARKALILAIAFTSILVIPLGISFLELVRQVQLEASLKKALLNRTITFQRVELLKSDINWLTNPPLVYLNVSTKETLTQKQVRLLEEFIAKEMGRDFTLIFRVNQFEEVRRDSSYNSLSQPNSKKRE